MHDVTELKRFAVVHARAQQIPDHRDVLARITGDDEGPGSWAGEWIAAGQRLEARGDLLGACRRYAMARFPFAGDPQRQAAQDRCVDAFDRWQRDIDQVSRLDVPHDGGRIRCWTSGLSTTRRKPLLIITGGIVTVKEQWAPVLLVARRLGMAGIVTEMAGVGENTVQYDESSWRMFSTILDAVADRALVDRTYAVALSFSGTMALRCAAADRRFRGLVLAGAPVHDFFTDTTWQHQLPDITVQTLAHLVGAAPDAVLGKLHGQSLEADALGALDIPVHCIVSKHDEIIPDADVRRLRAALSGLRTIEHDDVHGSPEHVLASRLWTVASILRMRGGRPLQLLAIQTLLHTIGRGR